MYDFYLYLLSFSRNFLFRLNLSNTSIIQVRLGDIHSDILGNMHICFLTGWDEHHPQYP